jgi:hypothetical protein
MEICIFAKNGTMAKLRRPYKWSNWYQVHYPTDPVGSVLCHDYEHALLTLVYIIK